MLEKFIPNTRQMNLILFPHSSTFMSDDRFQCTLSAQTVQMIGGCQAPRCTQGFRIVPKAVSGLVKTFGKRVITLTISHEYAHHPTQSISA